MIRREFEDNMGEAIVTVQMTVNDYLILKEFVKEVGAFNFDITPETIKDLRTRAGYVEEIIY